MIFFLAFCPLLKPVGMYVAYACRAENVQSELSRLLCNIYLLVHIWKLDSLSDPPLKLFDLSPPFLSPSSRVFLSPFPVLTFGINHSRRRRDQSLLPHACVRSTCNVILRALGKEPGSCERFIHLSNSSLLKRPPQTSLRVDSGMDPLPTAPSPVKERSPGPPGTGMEAANREPPIDTKSLGP